MNMTDSCQPISKQSVLCRSKPGSRQLRNSRETLAFSQLRLASARAFESIEVSDDGPDTRRALMVCKVIVGDGGKEGNRCLDGDEVDKKGPLSSSSPNAIFSNLQSPTKTSFSLLPEAMSVAVRISSITTTIKPQSSPSSSSTVLLPLRLHKSPTTHANSLRCSNSSFLNPIHITTPLKTTKFLRRRPEPTRMSMEAGVGLMGTKLGMMTYFESTGKVVPVTVIGFREGNVVTQVKTEDTDGYNAVQVGYRRVRDKKLTKPEMGHLEKSGVIPLRHLQEFRLQSVDGFEPNQKLVLEELFQEGDLVDVSGTTIGKGFQGGIKRHHFKRGLMTHGSKSHRALGSIGAGTTPGRVYKGKKMPGRMGGTKTKIRKLQVIKIDSDLRVVMIKGAVPGKPGNLIRITPAKIVGKNIPKS
ncbi:hypothetical protein L6452_20172 [Arctium lappa]|uniref:Uncharacterized protein n=1 Tax=Arctium lappa TaxID=4217 RepID=A0ACB9BB63_ARCLA|nr:hypothetical protein L6452_20172 [Arctium lappa]